MKVNLSLLLLSILMFSACGSMSVSNRGGSIKVENKPKQPNVIVNENVKENVNDNAKVKESDKT